MSPGMFQKTQKMSEMSFKKYIPTTLMYCLICSFSDCDNKGTAKYNIKYCPIQWSTC